MMGACFLIGGLRHRVQEFSLPNARLQLGMLFIAAFGLMVPSAITAADAEQVTQTLSLGVAILLIVTYGLDWCSRSGRIASSSQRPHMQTRKQATVAHLGRSCDAGGGHRDCGTRQRSVYRLADRRLRCAGPFAGIRRFHRRRSGRCCRRNGNGILCGGKGPPRSQRRYRLRKFGANRALRGARHRPAQLCYRARADDAAVLARAQS